MKPLAEVFAIIDRALEQISPEDLALKMMSYGMEFENPPLIEAETVELVMGASVGQCNSGDAVKAWCGNAITPDSTATMIIRPAQTLSVEDGVPTAECSGTNNELALAA